MKTPYIADPELVAFFADKFKKTYEDYANNYYTLHRIYGQVGHRQIITHSSDGGRGIVFEALEDMIAQQDKDARAQFSLQKIFIAAKLKGTP